MLRMMKPLLGAMAACACVLTADALAQEAPSGRPLDVQDIVELESFGRATVSPDGRWAVYEKRGPYNTATRFDFGVRAAWTIMDLWLVDLEAPERPPERLLENDGLGLQRLSWSPDSRHLLITRLQGDNLEAGVVTVADRSVWWTGLTPEMPRTGATAEWRSAEELVISIRPDRSLPELLAYDSGLQEEMTEAWRRSAAGREASRTVIEAAHGRATPELSTPVGTLTQLNVRDRSRRDLIDGEVVDFVLSPDKTTIAVILAEEIAPIRPERIVYLESARRQRLSLVHLPDGRVVRPMPVRDVGENLLRWSSVSQEVLVWMREDDADWDKGGLYRVGFDGAEEVALTGLSTGSIEQVVNGVRADWIGDRPVVYARPSAGGRFDWNLVSNDSPSRNLTERLAVPPVRFSGASERALRLFADGALWSADETGLQRLTPPGTTVHPAVPADPEIVRRLSVDAPRRDWTPATLSTGQSVVIDAEGRTVRHGPAVGGELPRVLAVAPTATLLLERTGMEETLSLRTEDRTVALDVVNRSKRNVKLVEPVAIDHLGVDGQQTRSWLWLPPADETAEVRGVVVDVYPGGTDSLVWWDPLTMTYAVRPGVLAAGGYAVLSPSMPGDLEPTVRGDTYRRAADLAVDAALAAHPELPADRLAIFGHSFGGYAAMEIATRSRRYRSVIASAGVYDWMGLWGEFNAPTRNLTQYGLRDRQPQGFTEQGQGRLGVPPWEATEAYLASSPWLRAEDVRAPVLLLTADLDFVPMRQAEAMFSALYREGKHVKLITYWGEKHHVWSPTNILDKYQQIFDWLDTTLPEPAGITQPVSSPMSAPRTRTPPPP